MRRGALIRIAAVLLLSGCGRFAFDDRGDAAMGDGRGPVDAPADATLFGPWSAPLPISTASSTVVEEEDGALTASNTELYFNLSDDIWRTERATVTSPWLAASATMVFNSTSLDETPRLSADDLTIYFASDRSGQSEIYSSTRTAVGQPWDAPVMLPTISNNGAWNMHWLSPCNDGHYITARIDPNTDYDLYEGVLGGGPPTRLDLNSPLFDSSPYLTPDCKTLYFATDRNGGAMDIFVTTRASSSDPWGPIVKMNEASFAGSSEQDPMLSQDGTMFLFTSDKQGASKDIYFMTRMPL